MLGRLRGEPSAVMRLAGMTPDPWQEGLLACPTPQMLMLCSRQSGKSLVAAALALQTALLQPGSPILPLSPTLRQSGELFRKVVDLFDAMKRPLAVASRSALDMELANGSRILSLTDEDAASLCTS